VGSASIEVAGSDAERAAQELRAVLAGAAGEGESVSAVEVDRSPELVIAIIGLVFAGTSTAKTMWDWWRANRQQGITVKILLADGSQVDLSAVNQQQLEIALTQANRPQQ
jgi:pantothenate kinase